MNFRHLDLNLLSILDVLLRTRSVTLAGEKLGLSQPAASGALQRLRKTFGDPLLVRTPRGMEPTALALSLQAPLHAALEQLRAVVEKDQTFDPTVSSRPFKLLMSDIAQVVHLPGLVSRIRSEAPGVTLQNLAFGLREAKQAMADGELDLAVGFLPDLGPDFHRQPLFDEVWVCVTAKRGKRNPAALSVQDYLRATHVSYRPPFSIHSVLDEWLEREFTARGVRRHIGVVVPYASGLGRIVAATDLVLTVPRGLATALADQAAVRICPVPFELPRLDLNMQWHARAHGDLAVSWLRGLIADSYAAKTAA